MNLSIDNFLSTLFESGEATCYTPEANGYRIYEQPSNHDLFFAINPLHLYGDLQPTQPWHHRAVGRRADCNVVNHRNFLVELDTVPLDEQIHYVLERLPVTSIVTSGGKSHHFIISLKEPVNGPEYAQIARRIHKAVPLADPTTKNPSRLSRLPFRVRPETGRPQELIELYDRISLASLKDWLPQLPVYAPKTADQVRSMVTPLLLRAAHEPDAIMQEFNLGGRNQFMFWMHKRMEELALDEKAREFFVSTAYNNLRSQADFSWAEACVAARIKG